MRPGSRPKVVVGVIASVAAALLLAAAFAGDPAPAPLPDPLQAGWRGQPVCERLHEDDRIRVLKCTFSPGVGHERHHHAPHWGYTVAGGRMRIEDASGVRVVDVPTGSSFESEGIAWHEVRNVGDTTAVFLIVEPR